ncbi:DUF397 domain-containing protein [Streptomyces sp. AV19]|uniref:DUF397 domain-containing protein n=1 Tax=Streptomyces sp. AV19 TaxID=2793068 RepID=UPI0018FEE184|nr:DUF397 domain-containing protein [Streptomyces sp. AV19]MBH1935299.1 DUF397 domain-containing protein [Streptomyces sp. AV19]MDG4531184.1 DUF397 domain-containing protein [Streptomyces sp. AV19]
MRAEPAWHKSSYSGNVGNDCLEICPRAEAVHVRDSKLRATPQLAFPAPTWAAFIAAVPDA